MRNKIILGIALFFLIDVILVKAPGEVQGGLCNGICVGDHDQCPDNLPIRINGADGGLELCEGQYIIHDGMVYDDEVTCCLPGIEGEGYEGEDIGEEDDGRELRRAGDLPLLLAVHNVGNARVGRTEERPCCTEERQVPDEGEVCCDGMPLDYREENSGRCGCPSGFDWNSVAQECQPRFFRCGYDPNEEDPNERNKCITLGYILTHPIECLFGGPESEPEGPLPYEQVCCPYMEYEEEVYYRPENVVVY